MNNKKKPNVLFLECGTSGQGGSYKSLEEHIRIMRDKFGTVIIVLVNESIFKSKYEKLNCKIFLLSHCIYTKKSNVRKLYNLLFSLSIMLGNNTRFLVQYLFEYRFSLKLVKIIEDYKINLIHLNDQPMRNFSGFVAARKSGVKIISHIRTLCDYGYSGKILNYCSSGVKFVAISEAVKRHWCNKGIKSNNVSVIYNSVNVNKLVDINCEKTFDLIYAGVLIKRKNVNELIDAISNIKAKINLVILGDGPEKKVLQHQVARLGLESQVIFFGFKKNVEQYIASSKVLVLPSTHEGFGRVIVEAMKLKTAVVVNNDGGMVELVTGPNQKLGIIYNRLEEKSLLSAINEILDKDKYKKIINNAYQYAMMNFTDDKYKAQFESILSSVITDFDRDEHLNNMVVYDK